MRVSSVSHLIRWSCADCAPALVITSGSRRRAWVKIGRVGSQNAKAACLRGIQDLRTHVAAVVGDRVVHVAAAAFASGVKLLGLVVLQELFAARSGACAASASPFLQLDDQLEVQSRLPSRGAPAVAGALLTRVAMFAWYPNHGDGGQSTEVERGSGQRSALSLGSRPPDCGRASDPRPPATVQGADSGFVRRGGAQGREA